MPSACQWEGSCKFVGGERLHVLCVELQIRDVIFHYCYLLTDGGGRGAELERIVFALSPSISRRTSG